MANSALSTSPFQAVASNIANDGSADSPKGWAAASDANYTFTSTSPSRVRCSGMTAARTVTLPTTNIKAGAQFEVIVSGATETNYVVLNSSGANEVDRIGGSGRILVVALQDAPTTAAHWGVIDVEEKTASFTTAATGANTNTITYELRRRGVVVTFLALQDFSSAIGTNSTIALQNAIPTRFRPTNETICAWSVAQNSSGFSTAFLKCTTNGLFAAINPQSANFTGICGFTGSNAGRTACTYSLI